MQKIKFTREETKAIVGEMQDYFAQELDFELGVIPAEMLLDHLAEHVGAYYYNRGLRDAQAVFLKRMEEVEDALYGLEQKTRAMR